MSDQHSDAFVALRPLAKKFRTGAVEIFGEQVVRPGDTMFSLLAVNTSGDQVELVFAAQGEEADPGSHFSLTVWGASGVKTSASSITIAKAEKVRWAARVFAAGEGTAVSLS